MRMCHLGLIFIASACASLDEVLDASPSEGEFLDTGLAGPDGPPTTSGTSETPPKPEYYAFEVNFTLDGPGPWGKGAKISLSYFDVPDQDSPDEIEPLCA